MLFLGESFCFHLFQTQAHHFAVENRWVCWFDLIVANLFSPDSDVKSLLHATHLAFSLYMKESCWVIVPNVQLLIVALVIFYFSLPWFVLYVKITPTLSWSTALWVVTSVSIFNGNFRQSSSNIFINGMTACLNRWLLATGGPKVNFPLGVLTNLKLSQYLKRYKTNEKTMR